MGQACFWMSTTKQIQKTIVAGFKDFSQKGNVSLVNWDNLRFVQAHLGFQKDPKIPHMIKSVYWTFAAMDIYAKINIPCGFPSNKEMNTSNQKQLHSPHTEPKKEKVHSVLPPSA